MSYGIRVVNDAGEVQLDGQHTILQFGEKGSAPANQDVFFSRPYQSAEPPWLFLRGGNGGYFMGLKFIGGAYNWTGFRLHACSDRYHNHGLSGRNFGTYQFMVGDWEVRPSTDTHGIRIWNENGKLVYDSGNPFIKLMYQFQFWEYQGALTESFWRYYTHTLSLTPEASLADPENYLLINPFVREVFNVPSKDGNSYRKIGPLTGPNIHHITRSGYTDFTLRYVHPGIVGKSSD